MFLRFVNLSSFCAFLLSELSLAPNKLGLAFVVQEGQKYGRVEGDWDSWMREESQRKSWSAVGRPSL